MPTPSSARQSPSSVRQSPRAFKPKSTGFEVDEYFKFQAVPPAREGDAPGAQLTHTRQSRVGQPDDAFGDRVMTKGEHRFVFTVKLAHSSSGIGLCLGVASATASAYSRQKFGVRISDGRCIRLPLPSDASATSGRSVLLSEGFLGAAHAERAVGRRVEVIVDMDSKRLLFSVDGASQVDSGVLPGELPEALVPWAQVFYKGDVVTLTHHRSRPTFGSPPSPPPVLVPKPSKTYDNTRFEAGPWTP